MVFHNFVMFFLLNFSISKAVFFLVRMRVREGGGGKEGKIRLVTYARFSFPVADFVTHQ